MEISIFSQWPSWSAEITPDPTTSASPRNPRISIGTKRLAAYAASKAAILGLTRVLARELGAKAIRVNSIVPGAVDTPRQRALWFSEQAEAEILEQQCLKFRVVGDDVARAALFLASDEARAVTGHSLLVDGGLAQTSVIM